jgi:hypothetical protein
MKKLIINPEYKYNRDNYVNKRRIQDKNIKKP